MRHAARHHRKQFGFGHASEEWPDCDGRFCLTHDNAGGHTGGFRATRAHKPLHHHGHRLHKDLHDAQVVQNGENRTDEDNDG